MQSEIWRVVLVTLLSFTIGLSLDKTIEALLVGLVLYILWSFRIVTKLFSWIDRGMRSIPPDTDGVWGEFADTLNRQRRRHRRAQEKMRRTIKRVTRVTEAVDEGVLVLFLIVHWTGGTNQQSSFWGCAHLTVVPLSPI